MHREPCRGVDFRLVVSFDGMAVGGQRRGDAVHANILCLAQQASERNGVSENPVKTLRLRVGHISCSNPNPLHFPHANIRVAPAV